MDMMVSSSCRIFRLPTELLVHIFSLLAKDPLPSTTHLGCHHTRLASHRTRSPRPLEVYQYYPRGCVDRRADTPCAGHTSTRSRARRRAPSPYPVHGRTHPPTPPQHGGAHHRLRRYHLPAHSVLNALTKRPRSRECTYLLLNVLHDYLHCALARAPIRRPCPTPSPALLYLSGYSHFPWGSRVFTQLASLEIRNGPPIELDPQPDFIPALEKIQSLESLFLINTFRAINLAAQRPPFSLPLLATLELAGDLTDCQVIMSHLRLPGNATLCMDCKIRPSRGANEVLALSSSVEASSAVLDIPIRLMHFYSTSCGLSIIGWESQLRVEEVAKPAHLRLSFEWSSSTVWDGQDLLRSICRRLPRKDLEALVFHSYGTLWVADTFLHLFGVSTKLDAVDVNGSLFASFCQALSMYVDKDTGNGHRTPTSSRGPDVFAPLLTSLAIGTPDFTQPITNEGGVLHVLLPKWLKERAKHGATLQEMVVYNCTWNDEWKQELLAAVPGLVVREVL
ncbi:hypothetical protein FA95DRAFT_535238 [Auriscalpium vulgare]|uniref:Uncharacterized protein n=1 Tax=Auriscalpium vulgare TaxID=40419 RepID=A0ACB8RGY1_9AGAM|nr:hypothetical protein FA95DRAFT_535238 [Auriscalpium vulgare]